MEPTLPVARALAIAGDRIAGRIETHETAGGVVVRDEQGEPTGVLREECAWHFRDAHVHPTEDELVEASRDGVRIANARGVTAVQDKDGWLGALGVWQRLRDEGSLH